MDPLRKIYESEILVEALKDEEAIKEEFKKGNVFVSNLKDGKVALSILNMKDAEWFGLRLTDGDWFNKHKIPYKTIKKTEYDNRKPATEKDVPEEVIRGGSKSGGLGNT